MILQIALNTPLYRVFDYRPPAGFSGAGSQGIPRLGVRVRVPFGRRQLIGILVGWPPSLGRSPKLKAAVDILDKDPIVDPVTFELLRWAAEYYHHPLGEVFAAALPVSLRAGQREAHHRMVVRERGGAARIVESQLPARSATARPARLAQRPRAAPPPKTWRMDSSPRNCAVGGAGMDRAAGRGPGPVAMEQRQSDVDLNPAQARCVDAMLASLSTFAVHLLYGVTGSGKTEVYLRVIAAAIANGGQAWCWCRRSR